MNIFSGLRLMDARAFPTGKVMHLKTLGEVVADKGKYADIFPWHFLKFTYNNKLAFVSINKFDYPIGTKTSDFVIKEFGRIGRRSDNKFHPEDALTTDDKYWIVTEITIAS